jgi:hypothetical protein
MTDTTILSAYTLDQALEDGVLVAVFKNQWTGFSSEKPIVATRGIAESYSLAALQEIWNDYVQWRTQVMPTVPEEEQLFSTTMNGETVWVLEDDAAFTILFPDEY